MEKPFAGKVAIVTGGAFGIGRATALAFAQSGAKVAVVDWKENHETINAIKAMGGEAIFISCNVADPGQVEQMVKTTVSTFGRLDYAFNNAGIEGSPAPTEQCTIENWDQTININLRGAWLCMKYEIPEMLKSGGGAIVNCASIAGLVGFHGMPAYVASKHGMVGLTKTAALDLAQSGIRVNALCPGVIKTEMIDRFTGGNKEAEQQLAAGEPMGRMGTPQEMADVVIWLCSDRSSFVTGQAIAADGGWVAK